MQDDQLSLRNQHIIEHLEKLWQSPQELSPDILKQIIEFVVGLEEPYQTIGLKKIAEHAISNMSLHILSLMATFQQKAESEEISSEHRDEIIGLIKPDTFQILDQLSKHLSIHSLDDVAALSNITVGLQTLSQVNSAEEAQSWLYDLPSMYYHQLAQESLLVNVQHLEWQETAFNNWTLSDLDQKPLSSVKIQMNVSSNIQEPMPLDANKIIYMHAA